MIAGYWQIYILVSPYAGTAGGIAQLLRPEQILPSLTRGTFLQLYWSLFVTPPVLWIGEYLI